MKIEVKNFAGNWEPYVLDCGHLEVEISEIYGKETSPERMTAFECTICGEPGAILKDADWREVLD